MDKQHTLPLSNYMKLMGVIIEQNPPEPPRLVLPWKEELKNTGGLLHGGAISTLVDSVIGYLLLQEKPGRRVATIELKVNYLKPVREGKVIAEGEILHTSSALAFGQANIYNEDRTLVAVGSATYRLLS